jgi:hypothetical protein
LWFCFDALADECRRNVEMSPGAQSRDDTPGGGGIGRRVGARCHKYDTGTRYNGTVCSATPRGQIPSATGYGDRRRFFWGSPRSAGEGAAGDGGGPAARSAGSIRLAIADAAAFTGVAYAAQSSSQPSCASGQTVGPGLAPR